jgi:hypothetical protein
VDLRELLRGRIGGWWWVTLRIAGISVVDCLGWRITGCLHLLGRCLLLFKCLMCQFRLEFPHGGIVVVRIIAFAIPVIRFTTFVKCL